jgi:HK97 family phage major capsid protein
MEDILKEVKGAIQPAIDKIADVEKSVKELGEKVKKIEDLPAMQAPAIKTRSQIYKGYNLDYQLSNIRNNAKALGLKTLADDEKADDFSKFVIDFLKVKRGDMSAQEGLKQFYAKAQMQNNTDSEGGYLVPQEYATDIIQLARNRSFALNECSVIPMSRDTLKIPKELTLVSVEWDVEEGAIGESEPTFAEIDLTNRRLNAYAKVTNELLQDSAIDIVGMLTEQFAYATGLELDNQVLNGTGAPCSGLLTANAGYSVICASGASMSTVTAGKFSEMISKIEEGYLQGSKFVINRLGLHYLRSLADSTGQPIFAMPQGSVAGTIFQYPYIMSEKIANTDGASKAFVVFGNLKKFLIGQRLGTMSLDVDPYTLFLSYATQFRIVTRWALANGNTSAFVRLLTSS